MKLLKELYWIAGGVVLTMLVGVLLFGTALFDGEPMEVQLQNTYFVFPKLLLIIILFGGLMIFTYLIRGIYFNLENRNVNMILTSIVLVLLVGLIKCLSWIQGYENLLLEKQNASLEDIQSQFSTVKWILWGLVVFCGGIVTLSGYKIFKSKK
ncbi:hypothetical protein AAG747_12350 [Rapidithrix thailandica]|uniref:Uncharacterized protein n=1 Tax=Rapidithrix thailandica TaxID=413964 RepID=A0AAW9SDB9_9BACT